MPSSFIPPFLLRTLSRPPSPPPTTESSPQRFSFTPEPLPPLKLSGYISSTSTRLLTPELAEEIRTFVPPRQQIPSTWTLVYSLEQHGASLSTLYDRAEASRKKSAGFDGGGGGGIGYVLVVRDLSGGTFGAYINEPLKESGGRHYGNGECFLWRKSVGEGGKENEPGEGLFKAFLYTGENDYCILCESKGLSIGGGEGRTGLYLDDRFERGVSQECPTFANETLTEEDNGKFDILGVEYWRVG